MFYIIRSQRFLSYYLKKKSEGKIYAGERVEFGLVQLIYLLNELAAAAAGLGDGPHCHGERRVYRCDLFRPRVP